MTQQGVVKRRLEGGRVEVEVERVSACAHDCDHCAGCGSIVQTAPVIAVAQDPLGARPGQRVTVETASSRLLGLAAALYLLPFAALFAAYLLLERAPEGVAALVGVGAFVAALLGVSLPLDRHLRRRAVRFRVVALEEG